MSPKKRKMPNRLQSETNAEKAKPNEFGITAAKRVKKSHSTHVADESSSTEATNQNNNESDGNGSKNEQHLSAMVDQITDVLCYAYFDVKERLNINMNPPCLQNLELCSVNHYKNGMNHNSADGYLINEAVQLISNDRLPLFMRFVSNVTLMNRFPGPKLVLKLLEIILVIFRTTSCEHYNSIL